MKFGSSLDIEEALPLECCKDSKYGRMDRSLKNLHCGTGETMCSGKEGIEEAPFRGKSPDRFSESIIGDG